MIILLLVMGLFLYAIPGIATVSVHASSPGMLKMIVKGAGVGAKYLSFISWQSILPLIFLLVGSGLLLFLSHRLKYRSLVFALIVATVGIGFFYGTRFIFPLVNPYKSARILSEEIKQVMHPGDRLALYGDFGSAGTAPYNLYTGIVPILEIEEEPRVLDLFGSKERVFCLFKYRDFEMLSRKYAGVPFHLIARRNVGDREMVLVSNR